MITSKALLEKTGLSRATLNNYISLGLLPKPEVKRVAPALGEPLTTLGYFPDWVDVRIQEIRTLKRAGLSMDAICNQLLKQPPIKALIPALEIEDKTNEKIKEAKEVTQPKILEEKRGQLFNNTTSSNSKQDSLHVSIDKIPYPAYMINYDCGLVWLNEVAQQTFFANTSIPERAEERSLIPNLMAWSKDFNPDDKSALFQLHFNRIKQRLTKTALAKNLASFNADDQAWLTARYDQSSLPDNAFIEDAVIDHPLSGALKAIAINFREGVLITYVPTRADANQLIDWLSQRDSVIRTLLSQRLPVLTPVAAMVADLQNSVRICSELPPEEYFQLINEIWSTLDPIFREFYGAYGKHTGDGMVFYFFPQPDRNYLMNAIQCAHKVRETMKVISNAWALKKGWVNQLYMNIGLSEGEEWLGTFKTNTSYELVVLGETINICSRLSDFARFGKIWATKNLVSKLTSQERNNIEYGVTRTGLDQDIFVANSYAQVSSLINKEDPRSAKLMDIGSTAVTEIKSFNK